MSVYRRLRNYRSWHSTHRIPSLHSCEAGRTASRVAPFGDIVEHGGGLVGVKQRVEESQRRLPSVQQTVVNERDHARKHGRRCAGPLEAAVSRHSVGEYEVELRLQCDVGIRTSRSVVEASIVIAERCKEAPDRLVLIGGAWKDVGEASRRDGQRDLRVDAGCAAYSCDALTVVSVCSGDAKQELSLTKDSWPGRMARTRCPGDIAGFEMRFLQPLNLLKRIAQTFPGHPTEHMHCTTDWGGCEPE